MKTLTSILLTVLATVFILLMIRIFFMGVYIVPSEGMKPVLNAGERIAVGKCSYGYRTPLMSVFGYNRWGYEQPNKDDVVVYNNPADMQHRLIADKEVFVGRCVGLPGEKIQLDEDFNVVNHSSNRCLTIPQQGEWIEVQPWNAVLLCNALILHEGQKAEMRDGELFVNGKSAKFCHFTKDYYWISTEHADNLRDSRMIGLVPHSYLIGKAKYIIWSDQWSRMLSSVK
ncbi:MAG: signal peptidase I [Bacteroidaceae bacterium]|nr:signal peptidase I [Bacteroidaceae bacterium]